MQEDHRVYQASIHEAELSEKISALPYSLAVGSLALAEGVFF